VLKIPFYVGRERFKDNESITPHSGWVIIEHIFPSLYQAMAVVDIWTITDTGVSPRIYTVEVCKLERLALNFSVFGRSFAIEETATFDISGRAPGYWLAQVKETGEIGEFL